MSHHRRVLILWCAFVVMGGTGVAAKDVLAGIGLRMKCGSSNDSNVEWRKKEKCDNDDPPVKCWKENALHIEVVSYHKDKGCYQCIDLDTNETLRNESLNIYESPKRVWLTNETGVRLKYLVGRLGDIVTLTCRVPCSNPEPSVLWEDSTGSSLGNGSLTPEGECNYTSSIDVQLTHIFDGNAIKCSAQNIAMWPAVSASSEVILVPANVTLYNSLSHRGAPVIDLQRGEVANVTCEATDAYPPPRFLWRLGGKSLSSYSNESDNNTVCNNHNCFNHISLEVRLKDHGEILSCTAWNHRGNEVTRTSKIKTRGLPIFERHHHVVEAERHHRVKINVFFFAYPNFITVKWERLIDQQWKSMFKNQQSEDSAVVRFRFDGKDLSLCGNFTTLVIPDVQEEDTGVYKVTVENTEGINYTNISVKLKTADNSKDFTVFWLVVVPLAAVVIAGGLYISVMYTKLRRKRDRKRVVPDVASLQSTPTSSAQSRPRLSTPRESVAGTYADIDEFIATNNDIFQMDSFKEAAVDVEGYEIPVTRNPRGRRPASDIYDINTCDRNPLTTASA